MKIYKVNRCIFWIALSSMFSISYGFDLARIDSYLHSIENKKKWSGFVLISIGDSIIFQNGYGFEDKENKIPYSSNTSVTISSGSKMFTGILIAKLAQEGKLQFSDYIGKYLPELPYGSKITIHQMLTHTSGLGSYKEIKGFTWAGVRNCTDLMKFIKNDTLRFSPGTKSHYSSNNYFLLGALIEKLRGKSYQDCVIEEIFRPLGMNNSYFDFWIDDKTRAKHHTAFYYDKIGKNLTRSEKMWQIEGKNLVVLSAGGISTCAQDLFQFSVGIQKNIILNSVFTDTMLMNGEKVPSTFWKYGYGWIQFPNGAFGNGNSGVCKFEYFPDKKITLILMQNCGWYINLWNVANKVEKILLGKETIIDRIPILDNIIHPLNKDL
jgi:CubicO group peptidase (beta-lactamase class C family)